MGVPFHESELRVVSEYPAIKNALVPVFDYPIPMKDAYTRMFRDRKPVWLCTGVECFSFFPDIIPDNRARGFHNDGGRSIPDAEKGGKDMFGIEWIYEPQVGGSIEKAGTVLFDDANDWEDRIRWPEIDRWDWEGCARRNREFLDNGKFNNLVLVNGCGFERLISFMGFENAAIALIDESQEEALKALFDRLSDLYCDIIRRAAKNFDIDGFVVHDDWGTQRAPIFSAEAGRRFLVPGMRKVTDIIHSLGKVAELHSCGCNELHMENFIAAGWDAWSPMASINDTRALWETYGDRILVGVCPEEVCPEDTEEILRAKARAFVEKYFSRDKICMLNRYYLKYVNGPYAEELYRASREMFED